MPSRPTARRQRRLELDESALCEDCRRRMVTNPLRVLDCKVPSCREHTAEAPKILDHNCPDCAAHFETVRRLLDAEKVPYVINHRLVRGLDYYTRTTFEIVSDQIGAQGTVAGGGRYDGLSSNSSAAPNAFPASVSLCGMERLALLLPSWKRGAARPDFFTVVLTDVARDAAYALTQALRDAGSVARWAFPPAASRAPCVRPESPARVSASSLVKTSSPPRRSCPKIWTAANSLPWRLPTLWPGFRNSL